MNRVAAAKLSRSADQGFGFLLDASPATHDTRMYWGPDRVPVGIRSRVRERSIQAEAQRRLIASEEWLE
jgi:hypothetical protein